MKLTACIFSILIFSQSIGMHVSDIFKIGDLIEHAQFHQENYGDDFFTFLSKHYGEEKEHHQQDNENEHKDHENLPFQHSNCHLSISIITPNTNLYNLKEKVVTGDNPVLSYKEQLPNNLFTSGVFQPPKVA